jgi:hypothetical protein
MRRLFRSIGLESSQERRERASGGSRDVADLESITSEVAVRHAGDDGLPDLIGVSLHGSWSLPPESSSSRR